jgi:hypothetical protein
MTDHYTKPAPCGPQLMQRVGRRERVKCERWLLR